MIKSSRRTNFYTEKAFVLASMIVVLAFFSSCSFSSENLEIERAEKAAHEKRYEESYKH